MPMIVDLYVKEYTLVEEGQKLPIRFALGQYTGTLRRHTPYVKCRDFLNDAMISRDADIEVGIYGFNMNWASKLSKRSDYRVFVAFSETKANGDKRLGRLDDSDVQETWAANMKYLAFWERKEGLHPSTVKVAARANANYSTEYSVAGDPMWWRTAWTLSLWTSLQRLAGYTPWTGAETLQEAIVITRDYIKEKYTSNNDLRACEEILNFCERIKSPYIMNFFKTGMPDILDGSTFGWDVEKYPMPDVLTSNKGSVVFDGDYYGISAFHSNLGFISFLQVCRGKKKTRIYDVWAPNLNSLIEELAGEGRLRSRRPSSKSAYYNTKIIQEMGAGIKGTWAEVPSFGEAAFEEAEE